MIRNQKGFTLIEIIAVLVILGILAAVAIPKFMDLQDDARKKALNGALAAVASTVTMQYSRGLLAGNTTGPGSNTNATVGDFTGAWVHTAGLGTVTIEVINGPTGWNSGTVAGDRSKNITLY